MNFSVITARTIVANYINRVIFEETNRAASNNPEIKRTGEARLDTLEILTRSCRTSSQLYELRSARELNELTTTLSGNVLMSSIIDDGVVDLWSIGGKELVINVIENIAKAVAVSQKYDTDKMIDYKGVLHENPRLLFFILLKQADISQVDNPLISEERK